MVMVGCFSVVITHKMFPTEPCEPWQITFSKTYFPKRKSSRSISTKVHSLISIPNSVGILRVLDYLVYFLEPELDGDQPVVCYYIDPCYAMERHAGKAKFKNKFYFHYEREDSWARPGVRSFGRVNGGTAFQGFQISSNVSRHFC